MKKLLLMAVVLAFVGGVSILGAEDHSLKEFNPSWTIHELAASEAVPVKRLAGELGLNLGDDRNSSLSTLGISKQDAEDALVRYRDAEPGMVRNIILVGMLIVFASLVVVAFLIGLFKHLQVFDKSQRVKTGIGTISSRGDLGERNIAAVVTTIFLYEEEVELENRLLLTWKRASSRVWKSGEGMPNAVHSAARRGR
ncbi:MAG: hypothetical protein KAH21_09675 [Spirochaetaceae bacterium]|nr:hypothetical protein [Spirochaetaceae bacterium]